MSQPDRLLSSNNIMENVQFRFNHWNSIFGWILLKANKTHHIIS